MAILPLAYTATFGTDSSLVTSPV